jgi:hypothetical protein
MLAVSDHPTQRGKPVIGYLRRLETYNLVMGIVMAVIIVSAGSLATAIVVAA